MSPTDVTDYRQSPTADLLRALEDGDALALAEVYHRTSAAAYACALRLLGETREAEVLLREVYAEVWREPPLEGPLEAWVRQQVFEAGQRRLREQSRPAASPSAALLLRHSTEQTPSDRTERAIAELDDDAVRALLLAHDRGTPTADQRAEKAESALRRALLALGEAEDAGDCHLAGVADWVLGLLGDEEARRVAATVAERPECADLARGMRRGRRKLEGLPPTPDLGQRVLAYVLAAGAERISRPAPAAPPSRAGSTPSAAPAEPAPTALHGATEAAPPAPGDGEATPSSVLDEDVDGRPPPVLAPETAGGVTDEDRAAAGGQKTGELPPVEAAPAEQPERAEQAEPAPAQQAEPVAPAEQAAPAEEAAPTDGRAPFHEPAPAAGADDSATASGPGRKVATVVVTILAVLVLLAAGAAAGLLLIRFVIG